jgi:hypothetical protein
MYEKAKLYQDAILDSNVVLSMDPKHTKARIRRARVYEAMVSDIEFAKRIKVRYFSNCITEPENGCFQ